MGYSKTPYPAPHTLYPVNFYWTNHAKYKMRFYRLSEQMVRGVIARSKRIEEGIAPGTIAYMKQAGSKIRPHEIWVMAATTQEQANKKNQQLNNRKLRVISAWRYPGITKPGKPLPRMILQEIEEAGIRSPKY